MTTITKQAAIDVVKGLGNNDPNDTDYNKGLDDAIAALSALPAVTVTDDAVWVAKVAYETELKAWRTVPDLDSQYNDRGTIKHKHVWVTDDVREADLTKPVSDIPETSSFKRIHLKTESAKEYIAWHAMKVALEAALTAQ